MISSSPIIRKTIFIVVGIVVVFGIALFSSSRSVTDNDIVPDWPEQVVSDLVTSWPTFQETFADRPVLGSTRWNHPNLIQFLSEDKLLIEYEDGHILLYSVIERNLNGDFALLETLPTDRITVSDRDALQEKYGRPDFEPITFSYSPEGPTEVVEAKDWKKTGDPF